MNIHTEIFSQFASASRKPIHIIPSSHDAVIMVQNIAKKLELKLFHLTGKEIRDRDTLFEALAHTMKFPEYFGRNWDALEECLRDLEWLSAQGYVILFEEPRHLLESSNDVFITFLEIVISVAQEWFNERVPFHLVLMDGKILLDLQKCTSIKHYIQVHGRIVSEH
jgi:RNAse (barnase) inhibitor barstar